MMGKEEREAKMDAKIEIRGVICPMVTPMNPGGEVDENELRKEVAYLINQGVNGVILAGSTGEGPALRMEEKGVIFKAAVQEAAGRIPILAGIIANTTAEALEMVSAAASAGADAIMLTPPYYYMPDEEGIFQHFSTIARQTDLPMVIYNVPALTKINVTPKLAMRLVEIDKLVGIKESSQDVQQFSDMLTAVGGRISVMTSFDHLLFPTFALGARGTMAATSTVFPAPCARMFDAVSRGDLETARKIHFQIAAPMKEIMALNFPAGIKAALEIQDRPAGPTRMPIRPADEREREIIRVRMEESGLL